MWILWSVWWKLLSQNLNYSLCSFGDQNPKTAEHNGFVSTVTVQKVFNIKTCIALTKTNTVGHSADFFLLVLSDSCSCGLSDRGVWGCLQSQGAEGGSAGRDGAMGRHPHSPPCAGTQSQDLSFSQRAARVSSDLTFSSLIRLFSSCRRDCRGQRTGLSFTWWSLGHLCSNHLSFSESANH